MSSYMDKEQGVAGIVPREVTLGAEGRSHATNSLGRGSFLSQWLLTKPSL